MKYWAELSVPPIYVFDSTITDDDFVETTRIFLNTKDVNYSVPYNGSIVFSLIVSLIAIERIYNIRSPHDISRNMFLLMQLIEKRFFIPIDYQLRELINTYNLSFLKKYEDDLKKFILFS